jgi:hypothetical protein
MGIPRRLSRAERRVLRLKAVAARLPSSVADTVNTLSAEKPSTLGVLRAWRRLGRLAAISPDDRNVLREGFVHAFKRVLHDANQKGTLPFIPADFGVHGYKELADLFVTTLERVGYSKFAVSKLRNIREMLVGELLELLVANSRRLHPDLFRMARGQVEVLIRNRNNLTTAGGNPIAILEDFSPPLRATDIWVVDASGRRKFIDCAYVSLIPEAGGTSKRVSFLVETEIKMPAAAGKAGKQIGRAQVRFELPNNGTVTMQVAGVGPVTVGPEQIVFAPASINRSLVTIGDSEQFRLSFTSGGGYEEMFLRVQLEFRAAALRALVDLALPGK